jgi:hypothetical protein
MQLSVRGVFELSFTRNYLSTSANDVDADDYSSLAYSSRPPHTLFSAPGSTTTATALVVGISSLMAIRYVMYLIYSRTGQDALHPRYRGVGAGVVIVQSEREW